MSRTFRWGNNMSKGLEVRKVMELKIPDSVGSRTLLWKGSVLFDKIFC